MKHPTFVLAALAFFALTAFPAAADDKRMNMPMGGKAVAESHEGKGKINSVDAKAGKLNITHDAITTLGWDGMTMDFEVQDKAMLANLKAGQKVTFKLIETRKGKYVISEIAAAK